MVHRFLRKAALVFVISMPAFAEVWDPSQERHDDVTLCTGDDQIQVISVIYLSRDTFLEEVSISELVNRLRQMDVDRAEAGEDVLGVTDHLPASTASLLAKCVNENYRPEDTIYRFSNTAILPNVEKGYVIVRSGKVSLRIVTEAKFVN